jgi:hypothetical protein
MRNSSDLVVYLGSASLSPNLVMLDSEPSLFGHVVLNLFCGLIDAQSNYSDIFIPHVLVFYHHLVV